MKRSVHPEVAVIFNKNPLDGSIATHYTHHVTMVASWALDFAKLSLTTPFHSADGSRMTEGDIAQRACILANAMWNEFEQRGWLTDLPGLSSLRDKEKSKAGF